MLKDRGKDSLKDKARLEERSPDFQRIEIITGVARRRRWSDEEKAQIVSESLVPGAGVSAVARRHGLCPSLLYAWRRQLRTAAETGTTPAMPSFVPVMVSDGQGPVTAEGVIEVAIGAVTVRVNGSVDGATLRQVLDVVRHWR